MKNTGIKFYNLSKFAPKF